MLNHASQPELCFKGKFWETKGTMFIATNIKYLFLIHFQLPLDVMNNYCSVGADAEVSLEFHESRGKKKACRKIINFQTKPT
jgi:hypothetical protein